MKCCNALHFFFQSCPYFTWFCDALSAVAHPWYSKVSLNLSLFTEVRGVKKEKANSSWPHVSNMEFVHTKEKYFGHIWVKRKCCFLTDEIRKFVLVQTETMQNENGGWINFITCPFLLVYTRKYMITNKIEYEITNWKHRRMIAF